MKAFVIRFAGGMMLRTHPGDPPEGGRNVGWEPLIWTRSFVDAEKFGSAETATKFAETCLRHSDWTVEELASLISIPKGTA